MAENQQDYEKVTARLEELVAKIEDPERDLSTLQADIAEALELIKWCREYVRGNNEQIEKLLEQCQ